MLAARRLARLNAEYLRGLMEGDVEWFERQLSDEFVCIEADGTMRDKGAFLEKVRRRPEFSAYHLTDLQVRLHGEVALVRGAGVFERADGVGNACRYVDVWIREEGEWRVVSAQVTTGSAAPAGTA